MKAFILLESNMLPGLLLLLLAIGLQPRQVDAFDKKTHEAIIQEVLNAAWYITTYTGNVTWSPQAKKEVINGFDKAYRTISNIRPKNAYKSFHNEQLAAGTQRLKDLRQDIVINKITGNSIDATAGRQTFGNAMFTLQNYYSATNYVTLNSTVIDQDLGRSVKTNPTSDQKMCSGGKLALDGLTNLTSGYKNCRKATKAGKCCSKDLDTTSAAARNLAKLATADYLELIIDDLLASADGEAALLRFIGRDTAAIFVVDTTISMIPELPAIKTAITNNTIPKFYGKQFGRYILISFGDNSKTEKAIRAITTTPDPKAIMDAVNALDANSDGAGDCREAGWTAVDKAIALASYGSYIYFWSDASQKGPRIGAVYEFQAKVRACLDKKVKIDFVLTGHCSPFSSKGFEMLAQQTGGDITFVDDPSQIATVNYADPSSNDTDPGNYTG